MLKISKLVLLVLTILTVTPILHLSAQQRTYSPLSRYGLGESQNIGYGARSGMGNTGIGIRSPYGANNLNIASLTALDSLSFYFDGGFRYFWQSQQTRSGNIDNSDMVFDYIGMSFSVSPNVSYTVGFKPLSSTGYDFMATKSMKDESLAYSELSGSGNLTQAYLGAAVKPFDNFSVGANISYLFGNLRNITRESYGGTLGAFNHGDYRELNISSILYDFGAQYTYNLNEKKSLTFGVTYRPKISLNGVSTAYTARGGQFGGDNKLFASPNGVDTLVYKKHDLQSNDMEYAASFGAGISYVIDSKLVVGLDYLSEAWGDAKHLDNSFGYKNTSNYSVGAEFIPKDRSAKSYLARLRYRAGAYYRDQNISVHRDEVNAGLYNYGITFGLGLPLKRSKTSINLAVELGKRSADGNSSFKQSYGNVTANFSLHEFWFRKRQID